MEVEEVEERNKIRENISNLSFEELLKLKEKIGSKTYNKALFGDKNTKKCPSFKRANKNRPREVSSKIRPEKLRAELNPVQHVLKKPIPRDPRFDPICGEFDEKTYKANYSFVNDIRLNEKKQLEAELESCEDPTRKTLIRNLLQRINNQIRESERRDKEETKKIQKNADIKEQLRRGEKPIYKKKSVEKLESLIDKYEELKKSNKIEKHIEKRSKKLSQKHKKKMD